MALLGEWIHCRDENIDPFLDCVGSPPEMRDKFKETHPKVTLSVDGDTYTMQIVGPAKTLESKFKVDEEFDHFAGVVADKRRRAIAKKIADGKFEIRGVNNETPIDRLVELREIVDGEMVVTLTTGDVVAKRYFKRP
ncbi:fatty acid-binding protein, liver-like [Glandiceps talaboti]